MSFSRKTTRFQGPIIKKPYIQKSCCTCACDRVPKKRKKKGLHHAHILITLKVE